ncbi:hypothetical protein [Burkholderia plantarii]|uniref:hypothetical protein n=1 Tax=Burkholderia plantarii TaxID=41899 RepID=UPI000F4E66C7|nr:hypothetical protein [Burkholderia plantarii]
MFPLDVRRLNFRRGSIPLPRDFSATSMPRRAAARRDDPALRKTDAARSKVRAGSPGGPRRIRAASSSRGIGPPRHH